VTLADIRRAHGRPTGRPFCLRVALLSFYAALMACRTLQPADRGDVVVRSRLGDVHAATLRAAIEHAVGEQPALGAWQTDPAVTREFLEEWLFSAALTAEALQLGLASTPEAREQLGARRAEALMRALDRRLGAGLDAPTDAQMDAFLEANSGVLHPGERVRLRHIFRRVAVHAPEEEHERARLELGGLRQRVLDGADFGALARQYSDSETAKFDGLIAPQSRGQLPAGVEAAVWGLAPGELSGVVETPIGFHVFRLEERVPAQDLSQQEQRDWARLRLTHAARAGARQLERRRLSTAAGAIETPPAASDGRPRADAVVFRIGDAALTVADLERQRERLPFAARHMRSLTELLEAESWSRLLVWQAEREGPPAAEVTDANNRGLSELAYAARLKRWQGTLSEDDLRAFFSAAPERFAARSRLRMRVLVLHRRPGASPHAAYERLDTLARELRAGRRDFADAAGELSDDPSAAQGGDLGFVLPRDFATWCGTTALERVQRLALGEIGGPLLLEVYREDQLGTVPEGHLLVRVEEREEPRQRTFEEARDDVVEALTADRALVARQVIRAELLNEIHAELHPERLPAQPARPGCETIAYRHVHKRLFT
jgi:parvulin-like peptidyl-prolyl isomerase